MMCSARLKMMGSETEMVLSHKSSTKEYKCAPFTTCLPGTALTHMATHSITQHRSESDAAHVSPAEFQVAATNDFRN